MIIHIRRRTSAIRRARRRLALLAASVVLGLSSVAAIAGTALPARAGSFLVSLAAYAPVLSRPPVGTVPVGQQVVLYASTNQDVGPTPYYIDIYDLATGTLVDQCATGVSCQLLVAQSAASTHEYVAYIAEWDPNGGPPPHIQAQSGITYVTWTNDGIQLALTGPLDLNVGQGGTFTATATGNIPAGGYTTQIDDEATGEALKDCNSTPVCSVSYTPQQFDLLIAFMFPNGISTLPPGGSFSPLATSVPLATN